MLLTATASVSNTAWTNKWQQSRQSYLLGGRCSNGEIEKSLCSRL